MVDGNSVVTVAETGVKTTIYGPGKVIINGRDVYHGRCLVDANRDPT